MEKKMEQEPVESFAKVDSELKKSKSKLWLFILLAVIILGGIVTGIVFLANAPLATISEVRDIFIIFLALESLLIGVVLIILVVQITTLVNLVQNEIKPILNSTKDTINTLKGTTQFLSQNLVDPVIKVSSYSAGIKRLVDLLNIFRK
jgi:cytoskeletal protein RodZ